MGRIILIFLLAVNLFGMSYDLKKGWNLLGTKENLDLNSSNLYLAWKFSKGEWQIWTKNKELVKLAKKYGFNFFNIVNIGEGFWLYSDKDKKVVLNGEKGECKKVEIDSSWKLISFCNEVDTQFLDKFKNLLVWTYRNGKWYGYSTDLNLKSKIAQNYNLLSNISSNEGVWVKGEKSYLNTKSYNIYYFYVDENGSISPLSNAEVYDKNNNLIGKTDNSGKISLENSNKVLHLDFNKFENSPVVLNSKTLDYVVLATKKEEIVQNKVSKLFDIGNYRLGGNNLFLAAKIPPKGFFSFTQKYGLIVKKFYVKEDTTISLVEVNESNGSILGAFKVKLEDSFGEPLSIEEDKFSGQFKPFMKSEKLNYDVALMIKTENGIEYLTDCIYVNGKYIADKYVDKVGEYLFVKRPLLYTHKIELNVDKAIIFDTHLNPHIIYKEGSFKSLNKKENITIFAPNYYPLKSVVGENGSFNLKEIKLEEKCFNLYSALSGEPLNGIFVAKFGDKIYNIDAEFGKFCISTDKNVTSLSIDNVEYPVYDKNLTIFKTFKSINSDALTYSDLIDNNGSLIFIYNTISGAKALNIQTDELHSVGNFYFNAFSNNLLGDLATNIYYNFKKTTFSKDDFFDDIGYFVNPFVNANYIYAPTTTAKIVLLNKDGTNPYMSPIYLKTYDGNKTNDLVYLRDFNKSDFIAVVNEGLIYDVNKSTQNVELLYKSSTPLNYYTFAKYENGFLVVDNGDLIDVIKNKTFFNKVSRVLAKNSIVAVESAKVITVYKNWKKLYNIKGNLIKLLLNKNDIFIVTSNSIYKNGLLVAKFKSFILNASLKDGCLLVELKNGKNLIFK